MVQRLLYVNVGFENNDAWSYLEDYTKFRSSTNWKKSKSSGDSVHWNSRLLVESPTHEYRFPSDRPNVDTDDFGLLNALVRLFLLLKST